MNVFIGICFVILATGIFSKDFLRGRVTKIAGATLLLFWSLYYVSGFFLDFPAISLTKGSFSQATIWGFVLLSATILASGSSFLRRFRVAELGSGTVLLISLLAIFGHIFKGYGILSYSFILGTPFFVSLLFAVLAPFCFYFFRARYSSSVSILGQVGVFLTFFALTLSTFLFTGFLEQAFADPDFNKTIFFRIFPSIILGLGLSTSLLVVIVIHIFLSMRGEAMNYASEVTKGLRQAKAKDEAMLASIGEGLVATGKDGNIVFVNRAFERLLGWREDEVQGRLFTHIVPMLDENGKRVDYGERPIQKILKQTKISPSQFFTTISAYYKSKNGKLFPVAITIAPILVEDQVIGAVEVFRDISKEKEIDKEKTEFVSLASHQLRTPLSTINWYTEMLLSGDVGKLTDNQEKYLKEIYAGSQRMVSLVNSLLNVSRLELGTFMIEPEPTDIVELAKDVIKEQDPQLKARKIFLEENFETNIPKIEVDPKLLRMVFQNLLSNAIKYTSESGHIAMSVIKKEPNVEIKVSDSGWGIPKEEQDKVFSKLFRASNVREQDTEGTGLGLYIVKSVVEQSGGTIRFESEEHKGTTFFISLPLSGMRKREGTKSLS